MYLDFFYLVICQGSTCIADLCFHDNVTLVLILNITVWGLGFDRNENKIIRRKYYPSFLSSRSFSLLLWNIVCFILLRRSIIFLFWASIRGAFRDLGFIKIRIYLIWALYVARSLKEALFVSPVSLYASAFPIWLVLVADVVAWKTNCSRPFSVLEAKFIVSCQLWSVQHILHLKWKIHQRRKRLLRPPVVSTLEVIHWKIKRQLQKKNKPFWASRGVHEANTNDNEE